MAQPALDDDDDKPLDPAVERVRRKLVRFAIGLGDITVTGVGEVVRSTPDGSPVVKFSGLHDLAEREIAAFVERRQRELSYPAAA